MKAGKNDRLELSPETLKMTKGRSVKIRDASYTTHLGVISAVGPSISSKFVT